MFINIVTKFFEGEKLVFVEGFPTLCLKPAVTFSVVIHCFDISELSRWWQLMPEQYY
jgi:hypothetical protein